MKTTNKVLGVFTRPVQLLLCAGAALLLSAPASFGQAASQPAATTTTTGTDVVQMQKYEVTGSRIRRIDSQGPSPVIQLTTQNIEQMGFSTFGDAIRALPINGGQAITPANSGNSFTPGLNSFNFRGLGNNNTLVLLNGRRMIPYATPGYDGFQTMVNLDAIPMAAIESVEILKDGASAIYGSDAVAGVLNVKLRKDYQGSAVTVSYGDYFQTNGAQMNASFITGASSGKASILVAATFEKINGVQSKDFSFANTADQTRYLGSVSPQWVVAGGNRQDVLDYEGASNDAVADLTSWGFASALWAHLSSYGYPGSASATVSGTKVSKATVPYDTQPDTNYIPEQQNLTFYTNASYDFADWISAGLEVSYAYSTMLNNSAPTPVALASAHTANTTPGDTMYIPANNPWNPWGVDIKSGSRRMVEAGPRINDVQVDTPRALFTLNGKILGSDFFRDWTWDAGALFTKNTVTWINKGTVPNYKLQQALNGLVYDPNSDSLSYNPDKTATDWYNWFGPQTHDAAMGRFLTVQNPNVYKLQYEIYDFHVGGPLIQLPGGPLAISIGGEHSSQKLEGIMSELNANGWVIGGSSGASFAGSRTIDSLYAELSVPVIKQLELQLAGRYERYSDEGFQQRVRPKVAAIYRPLDWLNLRASYSQSYKAPDLKYLYASKTVTFSSQQYMDPVTNDNIQIQSNVAGNPNLSPELADTYYGGINIEPKRGFLKGLYGSLDVYQIKQKNLLGQFTDIYDYNAILSRAKAGVEPFAAMVTRAPDGTLLYISDPYANLGNRTQTGIDWELGYRFTTRFGKWDINTQGNYLVKDDLTEQGEKGTLIGPYQRRSRFNVGVSWDYRDWSANLTGYFIQGAHYDLELDSAADNDPTDPDLPAGDWALLYRTTIRNQTYFNLYVTYSGFWRTKISVGFNNVFNQMPPRSVYETDGLADGVNYNLPRAFFIKITREF